MARREHHSEYIQEQIVSKASDRELIWRLLGYLRPYRTWLVIALLFLMLSKVIEAFLPIFIGHISQIILDSGHLDAAGKEAVMGNIWIESACILGLFLISFLFDTGNIILRSWTGQKSLYTLRMQVYNHILRMPLSYFDHERVGRLMTRTIHDIDQINLMFAESVIPIVGSLFLFLGMFVGIVIIDWRIALFVVAIMPVVWWLTHRFRMQERRAYDRIRTVVAAMNTFMQEHLMGVSTVRNFGLQEQAKKRFDEINEDECNAHLESIDHFCFFISAIEFMQSLSLILAFVLIAAFATGYGGFQAGTFFTFSLYVAMFFRPLADLAERYNLLQSAMAAAARIFHVLDTPSEKIKDQGRMKLSTVDTIAFENVWFAYEGEEWILKGLTLELGKGESSALVGMTGEGKSTLISLLMRFYEPQQGSIKINGEDIRMYSLDDLRRQFSVVLQDPVIFSGSIAENIAMFNSEISRKQIEGIIDYLGMEIMMRHFPDGLEYQLKEQGKGLSVGERQLISLARAAVHHRPVLILDEATANIDAATEHVIQVALKKILTHTTAIVIAHRLSTIQDVACIFVMQDGKIAEQGSHSSLLERKGIYENLYRLQFFTLSRGRGAGGRA